MKTTIKNTGIFLSALMLLAACGSKEKKGDAAEAKKETPAAATVTMKPLDLTANGIPFTIQAPEGAQVTQEEGTGTVVSKDRFNIVIAEDKFGEEGATAEKTKETALQEDTQSLNNPEMGMKMDVLKNDPTGFVYMTTNKQGGKICRFTYVVNKNGKNYIIKENFMALNDVEKSVDTGYSISQDEIEAMYNAVKQ